MQDRKNIISADLAEKIAIEVITFLCEDSDKIKTFMELTGCNIENIRQDIETRSFLAGVLSYLQSDESLLLSFCSNKRRDPTLISAAQISLEE